MAKKSVKSRNKKRILRVEATKKYTDKLRQASKLDSSEGYAARKTLNMRDRNQSPVRVRNRCASCGRPRGVLRKFNLCRICVRIAAMRGFIPGLKKASW